MELVVQFPARGSTQVLLCLFPGVLWLWDFLYSIGPHPVSSLHIYTFFVSRAFLAGAASQAGDADSSRAPGLTSGLQGSMNVHRGALLLVPQWRCISSFVFYIEITYSITPKRFPQFAIQTLYLNFVGSVSLKNVKKNWWNKTEILYGWAYCNKFTNLLFYSIINLEISKIQNVP